MWKRRRRSVSRKVGWFADFSIGDLLCFTKSARENRRRSADEPIRRGGVGPKVLRLGACLRKSVTDPISGQEGKTVARFVVIDRGIERPSGGRQQRTPVVRCSMRENDPPRNRSLSPDGLGTRGSRSASEVTNRLHSKGMYLCVSRTSNKIQEAISMNDGPNG
jgi:hypothetical protein